MDETIKKTNYQQIIWNLLSIAWQRKFWIIIPVLIGISVSIYLIKTTEKVYESSTLILVEGQKVPDGIVKSAVTGTAQDRLSTIKQQVLSRSFLSRIIEKFSLYESKNPSEGMSRGAKIKKIRNNISVSTRGRKRLESFSISFRGQDPETIMNVTNELASLVMEENLKIREEVVEGAIDFLDIELDNLKAELERQENRLGEYKRVHLGELPGQLDSNLRALDRFQANLASIQTSKKAAQQRIVDLERVLASTKRQIAQGNINPILEGDPALVQTPSSLMQRLNHRREELANLLIEYSEGYPDVVILRRNIKMLEKQVAQMGSGNEPSIDSQNELRRSAEAEPVIALKREIEKINNESNFLIKNEKEIQAQIKVYERRVENTPKREQELIILRRDYDNISNNYQTLLGKKLNAQISENLEKRQKGEQFRIIDSANFPENPIKPNRLHLGLFGIFGGLAVGIGLVFIREKLDNSIRNPEEVERITSVLVLAEIPDFSDEMRKHEKHKKQKVVDLERFSGRKKKLRRKGLNG